MGPIPLVARNLACEAHVLRGYLTASLDIYVLNQIHADFAAGAYARYGDPQVELFIHDEPRFYGHTPEYVRATLDEERYREDFLIIDADRRSTCLVERVRCCQCPR